MNHLQQFCSFFRQSLLAYAFAAMLMSAPFGTLASADEIVVPENTQKAIRVGGVECSAYPEKAQSAIDVLSGQSNGEMTAGELWQFFNAQGVKSMDQLSLCLDCDPSDLKGPSDLRTVDISSFELKIQDPINKNSLLTDVNLGNDTLLLQEPTSDPLRPEARLAVNLGYDFMERFSAASQEKVSMNISSKSSAAFLPRISIESNSEVLSHSNMMALLAFVAFWTVVFTVVNRLTKPDAAAL